MTIDVLRITVRTLCAAILPMAVACAPAARSSASRPTDAAAASATTVLDALQITQPQWVTGPRAAASVFVGDVYLGDLRQLTSLCPADVASVVYLSAGETVLRHGTLHPGPALVIRLRLPSP